MEFNHINLGDKAFVNGQEVEVLGKQKSTQLIQVYVTDKSSENYLDVSVVKPEELKGGISNV